MNNYNPFSLSNKRILVTGASSGIGQAIAIEISKMGGDVVISGRNRKNLERTFSLLCNEERANQIIVADLTRDEDIKALSDNITNIDGVVHCAGIDHRMPAKMISHDDLNLVMSTNFNGSVLLQSALLSSKKINKNASIVFISSIALDSPSIGHSLYSASKGAISSYAKCLALELAPRGTRVNCICPAMVWTNLILQNEVTEEQLKTDEARYPLKRYGKPEDIAYLAIYLLSDASSWMTGSNIDITGGIQ